MSEQVTHGSVPEFTVGDRLRKAREHVGLDQAQLANEIGISRGTVSAYESGATTNVRRIVMRAWAMRTGVPESWLRTGESPRPVDPDGGVMRARRDSNPQPSDLCSVSHLRLTA